ncbi:hypothetical protein TKK_0006096 [Trichogramma kaykai]
MSDEGGWFVVTFVAEKTVYVVPSNWLLPNNRCYWPPFKSDHRVLLASQNRMEPDDMIWEEYEIAEKIYRAETFDIGYEKMKLSENTSEVDEEFEELQNSTSRHDRHVVKLTSDSEENVSGTQSMTEFLAAPTPPANGSIGVTGTPLEVTQNINMHLSSSSVSNGILHENVRGHLNSTPIQNDLDDASRRLNRTLTPHKPSQNTTSKENEERSLNMINLLQEVLLNQNRMELNMQRLQENRVADCQMDMMTIDSFDKKLPLQNVDAFDLFEREIATREDYLAQCRNYLRGFGAPTGHFTTRGVLKALMTDELAMKFSFKGKKRGRIQKRAIVKTHVDKRLVEIVVQAKMPNYTRNEIKVTTQAWLKEAKKRVDRAIAGQVPADE